MFPSEKQLNYSEGLFDDVKITLRVLSDTFLFSFWHYPKNDSVFAICNKIKYLIQLEMQKITFQFDRSSFSFGVKYKMEWEGLI